MKKGRVCMALSGGVDSAVSAAMLHEEGYDVHAVFIKVWQPDFLDCTQEEDRKSAKRVAAALGISFTVLDAAATYKERVIDVMVNGYSLGKTPNPDILCNQYIKFGILAEYAQQHGFEYIATGHYAQVGEYQGAHCLKKAHDAAKDQVYFLSQISPEIISRYLFPVGALLKSETRTRAQNYGLPVFDKKDSQGLCFMGMVDMAEFLSHACALTDGDVLDTKGIIIGSHTGAQQFTLGQRHGFTLMKATQTPHYVVAVDTKENTITVSDTHEHEQSSLKLGEMVIYAQLDDMHVYDVQVRYHGALVRGTAKKEGSVTIITLTEPVTVAAGQVVVLYDGDILVGSGIVQPHVWKNHANMN